MIFLWYMDYLVMGIKEIAESILAIIEYFKTSEIINYLGYIFAFVTIVIAVIGWLVQYRLQINANNRTFINNIKNQSRIEIMKDFKTQQDWLSEVNSLRHEATLFSTINKQFSDLVNKGQEISNSKSISSNWIFILESYEVLFPKTVSIRKNFVDTSIKFNDVFFNFIFKSMKLQSRNRQEQEVFLKKVFDEFDLGSLAMDFLSLLEDIKIYIQNDTLGEIVKREVTMRVPNDLSLPYVIEENDKLIIKNYDNFNTRLNDLKNYLQSV